MEIKNNDAIDLALPENANRSLTAVYLKIAFIPLLVFALFLLGYLHIINLKVEAHSIVMMGILLVIALIFARHSAEYGCCLFEDQIGIFKKGLKDYIMSHLLVVGNRKKSNASFEDFIDEHSRQMRNENYASVAAGIFPMLGILGTFISIAISMPEFSSTNIDMLEKEIAYLLGGVGTAFYVSIYGIFLALWWIYFEKKGISKYQKLVLKYKNATKSFFWESSEISQGLMQEILNKNERIANSFEHVFNTEFNTNLNKAMQAKFDNFQDLIKLEQDSLKLSSIELEKSKNLIIDSVGVQKNLALNYAKIIESMQNLSAKASQLQENFVEQYTKLLQASAKRSDKFENMADEFKSEFISLSSKLIKNQRIAFEELKFNIAEDLGDFKTAFKEQGVENYDNSDVIEELKKSLANIDNKTSKIKIEKSKNEIR